MTVFPWAKTIRVGPCLIWPGAVDKDGYAYFKRQGHRSRRAHRAAYEALFGALPKGTVIMHSCDVRNCVALQHLSPGSVAANVADMIGKGRRGRPNVKLTETDVAEIRRRCRRGERQADIGQDYGITQANVSEIWRRKTWK